jgi:hypothetical protein
VCNSIMGGRLLFAAGPGGVAGTEA